MSKRPIYCNTNLVLLCLGLSEVAQSLHNGWGTTLYRYPICDTSGILRCNTHLKSLPRCSGCYVVTFISINFQDALDATLYQPCEATSRTLWMLHCNIGFNQLSRLLGCYVVTSMSSNSKTLWMLRCNTHFNQLPRRSGCYVVTSISINFQDALDATL